MSQADLARACDITPAHLSRIISGERNAGKETLSSIAHALRLPPELVFQKAGVLPQRAKSDPLTEEILHIASQLSPEDQQELLEIARLKAARNEQKRTNHHPARP